MKSLPYQLIPLYNFILGVFIWVLDATIDTFVIGETEENEADANQDGEESFIDSLFFTEGTELWMRTLIIIVLVSVGFYSRNIIHRQKLVENELLKHKHQLEDMVEQRAGEILEKNIALEEEVENRKLAEKELERLATTDPLTTLLNRRKSQQLLEDEIERVKRYKMPLSIIVIDADHFKSVNDVHGHNKGDEVLIAISRLLLSSVRRTDFVARWGGEEFLVGCVSSNEEQAVQLAEKIRTTIEQHNFGEINQLTVSSGVAQYEKDKNLMDFVNRADKALYLAKSKGRNRVEKAR